MNQEVPFLADGKLSYSATSSNCVGLQVSAARQKEADHQTEEKIHRNQKAYGEDSECVLNTMAVLDELYAKHEARACTDLSNWLEGPFALSSLEADALILIGSNLPSEQVRELCRCIVTPSIWRIYDLDEFTKRESTKFRDDIVVHPLSAQWAEKVWSLGNVLAVPIPDWLQRVSRGSGISANAECVPGITSLTIAEALEYDFVLLRLACACEATIGELMYSLLGSEIQDLRSAFKVSGWNHEDELNYCPKPASQVILNRATVENLITLAEQGQTESMPESVRDFVLSETFQTYRARMSTALWFEHPYDDEHPGGSLRAAAANMNP